MEAIWHFADCVIRDREPLVDGKDGLEATRILEAVERSAEQRRAVSLRR